MIGVIGLLGCPNCFRPVALDINHPIIVPDEVEGAELGRSAAGECECGVILHARLCMVGEGPLIVGGFILEPRECREVVIVQLPGAKS